MIPFYKLFVKPIRNKKNTIFYEKSRFDYLQNGFMYVSYFCFYLSNGVKIPAKPTSFRQACSEASEK